MKKLTKLLKEDSEQDPIFKEIGKVLQLLLHNKNAQEFLENAKPIKKLGAGWQGYAFKLSNGKVVKITQDELEAGASQVITEHNHPNIIEIFKVCKFVPTSVSVPFYMILEEEIIHNDNLVNNIEKMFASCSPLKSQLDGGGRIRKSIEDDEKYNELKKYATSRYTGNTHTLQKLFKDMKAAIMYMDSIGIKYEDLHPGNIGVSKDQQNFVIFDFGYSFSGGNPDKNVIHESWKNIKEVYEKQELSVIPKEMKKEKECVCNDCNCEKDCKCKQGNDNKDIKVNCDIITNDIGMEDIINKTMVNVMKVLSKI